MSSGSAATTTPLVEAQSWLPIVTGTLSLLFAAVFYDLHVANELFAFLAILLLVVTIVLCATLFSKVQSLNVTGMLSVFALWLVRGTIVRPSAAEGVRMVANETGGLFISTLLVILTFLTYMDRSLLMATQSYLLRVALCATYIVLALFPHPCSLAFGLRFWQLVLRSSLFITLWLMQDYAYGIGARQSSSAVRAKWTQRWWLCQTQRSEYFLFVMRSSWVLFAHDIFAVFALIVILAWCTLVGYIRLPRSIQQQQQQQRREAVTTPLAYYESTAELLVDEPSGGGGDGGGDAADDDDDNNNNDDDEVLSTLEAGTRARQTAWPNQTSRNVRRRPSNALTLVARGAGGISTITLPADFDMVGALRQMVQEEVGRAAAAAPPPSTTTTTTTPAAAPPPPTTAVAATPPPPPSLPQQQQPPHQPHAKPASPAVHRTRPATAAIGAASVYGVSAPLGRSTATASALLVSSVLRAPALSSSSSTSTSASGGGGGAPSLSSLANLKKPAASVAARKSS